MRLPVKRGRKRWYRNRAAGRGDSQRAAAQQVTAAVGQLMAESDYPFFPESMFACS